jgi:hypothetical protein
MPIAVEQQQNLLVVGQAALEEFIDIHWTMVVGQPCEYPI